MAFLYSNHFSGIDFSISEILDISQTISRDFQVWPAKPSEIALSQQELRAISLAISRDFAPYLHNPIPRQVSPVRLTPSEIREISTTINAAFTPKADASVNHLVLLPVDPENLYAYWQLTGESFRFAQQAVQSLTLRIASNQSTMPFDYAVDTNQGQQKITVAKPLSPTVYSAALGQCQTDNVFSIFAHSNQLCIASNSSAETHKTRHIAFSQLTPSLNISGNTTKQISKTASGQNQH
jgi:hypothetical protein